MDLDLLQEITTLLDYLYTRVPLAQFEQEWIRKARNRLLEEQNSAGEESESPKQAKIIQLHNH